jgi:hypothetical protein
MVSGFFLFEVSEVGLPIFDVLRDLDLLWWPLDGLHFGAEHLWFALLLVDLGLSLLDLFLLLQFFLLVGQLVQIVALSLKLVLLQALGRLQLRMVAINLVQGFQIANLCLQKFFN